MTKLPTFELLKEFREFAVRGNIIDLAAGIVIGAAFGRVVTSFVNDILMPPIGLLVGKVDFFQTFFSASREPAMHLWRRPKLPAPRQSITAFSQIQSSTSLFYPLRFFSLSAR